MSSFLRTSGLMTDPDRDHVADTTPLDTAWTLFANLAIGFSVFAFVFLSAGTDSLFKPPDAPQEDSLDVNRAYVSAMISGALLLVLAILAIRTLRTLGPRPKLRLPRFQILEGKEGPRDKVVAVSGAVVIFLCPATTIYSALRTYGKKSRASGYDDLTPMDATFWASRWNAISTECDNEPCYRLFPDKWSLQWLWYSDVALGVVLFCAVAAWSYFCLRLWRERMN